MNKTLPLLILSVILLKGHTLGKSVSTVETAELLTSNQHNDTRKAFQNAVITKLSILSEEPLKLAMKLLQDTCDDNLDNENEHMLTQMLNDLRNVRNETKKIQWFLRLSVAFDFYSGTIVSESRKTDIVKLLQTALQRHDVKGVAIEFQKSYDEFLKWLLAEIDVYSYKVSSGEQLRVIEFKKLCIQFKETANIDDKIYAEENLVAGLK